MESIYIREGAAGDIPLIRELAGRTWWPAYREILAGEQIRYMLDRLYSENALQEQMERGHCFLLAYKSDRPLGFASWSVSQGSGTCRLHKIYVLPETQGKGTGRFLINTVELKAKEQGCQVLELNVNRFNKARSFYEKLGFKVQRTEDIPIGPFFMNDYIMQKIL
ncbi:ribosomal protein S18 acetylase RimI-like enzyme [Anseongella ginsenosidimutans]|uniref:Ribosomal protein S18 acetylase RimI-like enzyme n=1 Tax=Anseongella ginsenosidimutans TaxID=496056 RepID=A0A4V2UU54_9SPHI|nr:GNAT family N-acetyltransferase [Anseongella ginsenosidimutans]TCS89123.1 ribosomal protein S18 acetylase RimI-like enzyme [Anseongella ginsenosidimutans]